MSIRRDASVCIDSSKNRVLPGCLRWTRVRAVSAFRSSVSASSPSAGHRATPAEVTMLISFSVISYAPRI